MTHLCSPLSSCDRRRFLRLGTAGVTAALAGCFGLADSDRPGYTNWIPPSNDPTVTAHIDLRVSRESPEAERLLPLVLPSRDEGEVEEFIPDISGLGGIEDPLLAFPLRVGGQIVAMAGLGIAAGGLGYLVDPDQPDRMVDEILMADGVAVATGDIDVDEADEELRDGTAGIVGPIEFEHSGDDGEFAIYEPTRGDIDGITAVSETTVLAADTREEIREVLDAWRGDGDRAVDESSPFAWLVETAGDGDFAVGWEGPIQLADYYIGDQVDRPADGLVSRRDGAFASVSFSPDEGEITAELAVGDDELDGSLQDRIGSTLGQSSEAVSVTDGENRVSVTGTYSDDVLDLEFTEPERAPEAEERTPSGDPPSEVREAVPDDAFSFSYDGEQQVRVSFEREFEAEEVTVRAVESEWETSITTPEVITYINAYIDPEGDEVRVIVTVEGKSGVVATREFP